MSDPQWKIFNLLLAGATIYLGWWTVSTPTPDLLRETNLAVALLQDPIGFVMIILGVMLAWIVVQE